MLVYTFVGCKLLARVTQEHWFPTNNGYRSKFTTLYHNLCHNLSNTVNWWKFPPPDSDQLQLLPWPGVWSGAWRVSAVSSGCSLSVQTNQVTTWHISLFLICGPITKILKLSAILIWNLDFMNLTTKIEN